LPGTAVIAAWSSENMKLAQIRNGSGGLTAAVMENNAFRRIEGHTMASLIAKAEAENRALGDVAAELASAGVVGGQAAIPVVPAEVWACGCTYAPSAEFRDTELGTREGMYAYVSSPKHRPEIFFKGTDRVCVGPGEPIGIRSDSSFTAPEPELAVVINSKGVVLGYTLGNDVSAWDIERENALYLPQSKVYKACCALGPVIVTPDEIPDPYNLRMTCQITRGGKKTFEGSISTSKLRRKVEELVEYLLRCNPVPSPTVVLTGTGIIVTQEAALAAGDVVTIAVSEIGKLINPAVMV
jgi:2-dehydro-3-deoxy-D-arabinonate dehydratase